MSNAVVSCGLTQDQPWGVTMHGSKIHVVSDVTAIACCCDESMSALPTNIKSFLSRIIWSYVQHTVGLVFVYAERKEKKRRCNDRCTASCDQLFCIKADWDGCYNDCMADKPDCDKPCLGRLGMNMNMK
jgi:hypothetical protein